MSRIRPSKPSDIDRILVVWEDASRAGHPFLTDDFLSAEREKVRDVYMPAADTWVCDMDDQVLGFVSLIGHEVGALFVHPSRHRQGIGRALLETVNDLHPNLEVDVFKENAMARAFYHRCGFVLRSERTDAETGRMMLRLRYEAE